MAAFFIMSSRTVRDGRLKRAEAECLLLLAAHDHRDVVTLRKVPVTAKFHEGVARTAADIDQVTVRIVEACFEIAFGVNHESDRGAGHRHGVNIKRATSS